MTRGAAHEGFAGARAGEGSAGRATLPFTDALVAELRSDDNLGGRAIARPHPLLLAVSRDQRVVVLAPASLWDQRADLLEPLAERITEGRALVVLIGRPSSFDLARARSRGVAAVISADAGAPEIALAIVSASELLEAKARAESRGKWLDRYRYELGELIEIAKAVTTEREIDTLLHIILEKSRYITGADAGSVYVVEGDQPMLRDRSLRFKLSQNASVAFDSREFTIPVGSRSVCGYVALHRRTISIPDVYSLSKESPFGFDVSFDARVGYLSRSMLCAPLLSRVGDVIGVIQLINKKRDPDRKLLSPDDVDAQVVPFDERSEELLSTLAAHAGVALENAVLYTEIQRMMEGFVKASVEAIEQRDPTTSGHSRRVAALTLGLARAVERADEAPYRGVSFTKDDLRELSYASLLHDFGKIGVREEVLIKAKKLYPHELEIIRWRFESAMRSAEADVLSRKLRAVQRGAPSSDLIALDQELAARRAYLAEALAAVRAANEPTVTRGGDFARIEAISLDTFTDAHGNVRPLLRPEEVMSLSIARGTLSAREIDDIRSHVVHTVHFLSQIPWGKTFRRIPVIAGSHHERLNGTGYPNRLRAEEIPLQSKMMSVSDIFDALTASDRPYKKAVPLDRALDILSQEVKDGHIDPDLVRIFIEAKVWASVDDPDRSSLTL